MPKIESSKRFSEADVTMAGGGGQPCNDFELPEGAPGMPPSAPRDFLRWLLDYEIRGSERYRRFLSVLMVASNRAEEGIDRLTESFRRSDEVVALDKWHAAILLRETNIDGTINAINRYKSFHNVIHLRFAVVCYPTDGWNATYILESASDRIARAMHGPAGAIIS